MNDRDDESPERELTHGILDKLERAKTAERKLRKAHEGKVIATTTPDYGSEYNATRNGYVVNPEKIQFGACCRNGTVTRVILRLPVIAQRGKA